MKDEKEIILNWLFKIAIDIPRPPITDNDRLSKISNLCYHGLMDTLRIYKELINE